MSDMREPEPPQRVFDIPGGGHADRFEIEIAAWPYSSLRNEKVISRSLVYRVGCRDFADAARIADMLRQTVDAIHDVWMARIERIQIARSMPVSGNQSTGASE